MEKIRRSDPSPKSMCSLWSSQESVSFTAAALAMRCNRNNYTHDPTCCQTAISTACLKGKSIRPRFST